jgi:replicative DNA helicase
MSARIPPNDALAERAVIAAAILDPAMLLSCSLTPDEFYSGQHAIIWSGVIAAKAAGHVDLVSVAAEIKRVGQWHQVEPGYLIETMNAAPCITREAFGSYVRQVSDTHRRRQMLAECQRAEAELYAGTDADVSTFGAALASRIASASEGATGHKVIGYRDAITALLAGSKRPNKISTGIRSLDDLIGGLFQGDLTIVAARPGLGKSSIASGFAQACGAQGKRAIFVSLEMPATEIFGRSISSASGVPFSALRRGSVSPVMLSHVAKAADDIRTALSLIDVVELCAPTIERVRDVVASETHKGNVGLVIVDYIQIMGMVDARNRVSSVQHITSGLKAIAKTYGVPVVALSQLSRGVESRDDKRPQLSDLRDSGSIEQDADNVILIYRAGYYANPRQPSGEAELDVAKCRNGETGVVTVHWEGSRTLFRDSDQWHNAEAAQ